MLGFKRIVVLCGIGLLPSRILVISRYGHFRLIVETIGLVHYYLFRILLVILQIARRSSLILSRNLVIDRYFLTPPILILG